jgi:hypothetical protein
MWQQILAAVIGSLIKQKQQQQMADQANAAETWYGQLRKKYPSTVEDSRVQETPQYQPASTKPIMGIGQQVGQDVMADMGGGLGGMGGGGGDLGSILGNLGGGAGGGAPAAKPAGGSYWDTARAWAGGREAASAPKFFGGTSPGIAGLNPKGTGGMASGSGKIMPASTGGGGGGMAWAKMGMEAMKGKEEAMAQDRAILGDVRQEMATRQRQQAPPIKLDAQTGGSPVNRGSWGIDKRTLVAGLINGLAQMGQGGEQGGWQEGPGGIRAYVPGRPAGASGFVRGFGGTMADAIGQQKALENLETQGRLQNALSLADAEAKVQSGPLNAAAAAKRQAELNDRLTEMQQKNVYDVGAANQQNEWAVQAARTKAQTDREADEAKYSREASERNEREETLRAQRAAAEAHRKNLETQTGLLPKEEARKDAEGKVKADEAASQNALRAKQAEEAGARATAVAQETGNALKLAQAKVLEDEAENERRMAETVERATPGMGYGKPYYERMKRINEARRKLLGMDNVSTGETVDDTKALLLGTKR